MPGGRITVLSKEEALRKDTMGVRERKVREKKALRGEILDAAREIFVKEGYDGVSMRAVAEKIEYSPTTIYLYFTDKSDLMFEICQETFAKLRKQLEFMRQQKGDPLTMLRRGLRTYIEFGLKHPQHYIATFVMPHQHEAPEDVARYNSPDSEGMKTFAILHGGVQEAIRAGKIRGDADTVSRALWAGIHGITSLLIVHAAFPWGNRERVIDLVVDSLIEGLKAGGLKAKP
jgi:AcrR family transcriptional regulator